MMKTTTFFTILTITIFLFAFSKPKETYFVQANQEIDRDDVIILNNKFTKAILKTSNGCGVGNFLIPVIGDSSQGQPPTLMALSESWPLDYVTLDTIFGNKILGTAFKRESWQENTSLIESNSQFPYIVITDLGMASYSIPDDFDPYTTELNKVDSLHITGIKKVAKQTTIDISNPIALLVNDDDSIYNIQLYSYPNLEEQFSFDFHFEPEIFEVNENNLFITGQDTTGDYMLYHYSTIQDTLYAKYTLNNLTSNAQELLKIGSEIYILSSPGDSNTILSNINLTDSIQTQIVINPNSGARATHNEFKSAQYFTFQPSTDSVNEILNRQILILNPLDNQTDTLFVNLELDYFKYPEEVSQAFGFYTLSWLGAKWEDIDTDSDTVYFNIYSDHNIKVNSNGNANYINATYGCWVNVVENELDKIKFEFFPNPASSEITINLTGLVRGQQYKLDIIDSSGKIYHTINLTAYEKLILPIENFASGIYFMNLDTGRNLITQKLIIQ